MKPYLKMFRRTIILSAAILASLSLNAGNPARALKTKEQAKTIEKMVRYDDNFYSVKYLADYKLDMILKRGCSSNAELIGFVATELLTPIQMSSDYGAGCSAFLCRTSDGDVLYCRNFDYDFRQPPMEMLCMVPSKVSGANSSVSMSAMNFIGLQGGQLSDGQTDISAVMGAPYASMDGMNDKGLAISVLQVVSYGAQQYDPAKPNATTSLMIRWILDRASTVDEAVEMFKSVNFFAHGDQSRSNYHFFIGDKTGKSVVVEYVQDTPAPPETPSAEPYVISVTETSWAANDFFYPAWSTNTVDKARNKILDATLKATDGVLDYAQAWKLLGRVSADHTRWSVIYNLTRHTADLTWEHSGRTEHVKL